MHMYMESDRQKRPFVLRSHHGPPWHLLSVLSLLIFLPTIPPPFLSYSGANLFFIAETFESSCKHFDIVALKFVLSCLCVLI